VIIKEERKFKNMKKCFEKITCSVIVDELSDDGKVYKQGDSIVLERYRAEVFAREGHVKLVQEDQDKQNSEVGESK
jgi:hypothetical protein